MVAGEDYFHQLHASTPTRMWVNNPTVEEARLAVAAGAIACTTNPTFSSRIIKQEPDAALPIIDEVVRREPDDDKAADLVQQRLFQRIAPFWEAQQKANPASDGYVSLQGDPYRDDDADHILDEAHRHRALAPNYVAKIPATRAGLIAIGQLLREGVPVIATEIFAMAQAIEVGELAGRVKCERAKLPPLFVTHITGIYDEYLVKTVERDGNAVSREVLDQAGCALARKQHRLWRERGYPGILLGGGARATRHFTEMVGGRIHVTINYSTIQEIFTLRPAITPRMDAPVPEAVTRELCAKVPDFRRAWDERGLTVDEFAPFGPVQYFLGMFRKGWDHLKETIHERRRTVR